MNKFLYNKKTRYVIVGILTACVYMITGSALSKSAISINRLATLSFMAAVATNYILQKMWVFQDARPMSASLPKFFVMTLVGYVTNSVVFMATVSQFLLPIAQLLAGLAVVILNVLFSFLWVFAASSKRDDGAHEAANY